MRETKVCFKCNIEKPIIDYYKHYQMLDGHLNKCKACNKKDTKERIDILNLNPKWAEKEKERHRDKYYRLGYKEKHKPSAERKKKAQSAFYDKYPEKKNAKNATSGIKSKNGNLHHWSYREEHIKDVIDLKIKDHYKAHRFLIYDQERLMYRRIDNMELLDTKEKHEKYIEYIITNKD